MKLLFSTVLFFSIMLLCIFPNQVALAQESFITVKTPDKAYEEGETIVVSGKIATVIGDTPVLLQIFHRGNTTENFIEAGQIDVAQDGTFTRTILAEGPQWRSDGEYVVRVSYGEGNIAETSFTFSTKKEGVTTTEIFEVDAGSSGTFDVKYTIKSGEVEGMSIDPDNLSLVVNINSVDDGSLTLSLPREYIDAKKQDDSDDTFIVLINDLQAPYQEVETNDNMRTIKIQFEEDDSEIMIIGTFVIPEFGAIAALVLAVTISVILIVSKKSQLLRSSYY